jgi:hypothetical protein
LLNHAISLDDKYNFTQGLMGDYYLRIARAESDLAAKKAALEQAISYYSRAVEVSVGRDSATKYSYLISLGNSYIEAANLDTKNINQTYAQNSIDTFLLALDA